MKCRKCGEEAVILVPVKAFVEEYRNIHEPGKMIIKPRFFEGVVMWLKGTPKTVIETERSEAIHGHYEKHYEGRCEQCWKAERMTDGPP